MRRHRVRVAVGLEREARDAVESRQRIRARAVRLVTVIAGASPERTRPCRIAPPIEPAPRIAIEGGEAMLTSSQRKQRPAEKALPDEAGRTPPRSEHGRVVVVGRMISIEGGAVRRQTAESMVRSALGALRLFT
jgi:hypothetical protein